MLLAAFLFAAPASAHKDHQKKAAEDRQKIASAPKVINHPMSVEVHQAVANDLARLEEERVKSVPQRLQNWLGRIHPFAVHFPLALFPISWIALILARRRGAAEPLLRSLIIVAGLSAGAATFLGWLNGGIALSDADPLMLWHRWLGTFIGVIGVALAAWTWQSSSAAYTRLTVWALGAVTALLMVQGWLGAALVHGADHLNW